MMSRDPLPGIGNKNGVKAFSNKAYCSLLEHVPTLTPANQTKRGNNVNLKIKLVPKLFSLRKASLAICYVSAVHFDIAIMQRKTEIVALVRLSQIGVFPLSKGSIFFFSERADPLVGLALVLLSQKVAAVGGFALVADLLGFCFVIREARRHARLDSRE
jgi:hypothetical protein